jgi:hypothetical protein
MAGRERTLAALSVEALDRAALYIHGINEAPIIGIGRHLTDGLPERKEPRYLAGSFRAEGRMSRGSPSARSPMMLSWMLDVPPAMAGPSEKT